MLECKAFVCAKHFPAERGGLKLILVFITSQFVLVFDPTPSPEGDPVGNQLTDSGAATKLNHFDSLFLGGKLQGVPLVRRRHAPVSEGQPLHGNRLLDVLLRL